MCRCGPVRLRTRRDVRACTAHLCRCCLHPDTCVLWFFRAIGRKVCSLPESLLAESLQHISKTEELLWGLVLTFWQTVLYAVREHFCSEAGIYMWCIYGTETKFLITTLPSGGKLTLLLLSKGQHYIVVLLFKTITTVSCIEN